jgi:hypothetical protein
MAGIDADGGGIDIYPDLTKGVVSAMGQEGNNIHDTWNRKLGEIAGLDSQLGKGPLGAKAYSEYQPFVDAVRKQMDDMKPPLDEKVRNGNACVDIYVAEDAKTKQAIDKTR